MCNAISAMPTAAAMHNKNVSKLNGSTCVWYTLHLINESAVPLDG